MDQSTQPAGTPAASLPNNFVGSSTGESTRPPEPAVAAEAPASVATPAQPKPAVARPAMPDEALRARLERARKQERDNILKMLGTDSPEKVKADLEELKKIRETNEKSDREKMTREQQLMKDLETDRARIAELEGKLREESTARVYEKQDVAISQIASRHIDTTPIKLKSARREFAEYVESLPKSQVARMGEKDIEKWFAKFAKDNPDFARKELQAAAQAVVPKAPPAPVRKPAGAPPTASKKPAPAPTSSGIDPSANSQGKTFRPGQANSMSKAEVAAELKSRGLRGWR